MYTEESANYYEELSARQLREVIAETADRLPACDNGPQFGKVPLLSCSWKQPMAQTCWSPEAGVTADLRECFWGLSASSALATGPARSR